MRWLVLAVVLAGCSGTAPSAEPGDEEGAPMEGVAAPTWSVGDHWTLRIEAAYQGTASVVVTALEGGTYRTETNEPGLAYFDAKHDISWLGPQRASDLAGHQGGQAVEYLRFPLTDGARWSTVWDGQARDIVARQVSPGRFDLTATESDGHVAVRYQYDDTKRWVTAWTFLDRDGGERKVTVTDSGTGFQGTIYRYGLLDAKHVELTGTGDSQLQFDVRDDVTHLGLQGSVDCGGSGQIMAVLRGPQDDGTQPPVPPLPLMGADWETGYACPGGGDNPVDAVLPARGGRWWAHAASASDGASIILDIEPRIETPVPFPS